jgi:hypothetical protein
MGKQKKCPPSIQKHREILIALNGSLAGKSLRQIALDLYPPEHVASDWFNNSALKNRVRRRVERGRYFMNGGYETLLNYTPKQ